MKSRIILFRKYSGFTIGGFAGNGFVSSTMIGFDHLGDGEIFWQGFWVRVLAFSLFVDFISFIFVYFSCKLWFFFLFLSYADNI